MNDQGWQSMDTAPKDKMIEGLYEEEGMLIEWRDDRYCMLGRRAGSYPPGWVGIGSGGLPEDDPEKWRPVPDGKYIMTGPDAGMEAPV